MDTEGHPNTQEPDEAAPKPKKFNKWKLVIIALAVFLLAAGAVVMSKQRGSQTAPGGSTNQPNQAVKAGKQLSNGQCEGEGVTYKLSRSPMDPEDFSIIIPYGLMVGDHVTPIDHQYFSPKDYNSPLDSYEVRAMADSHLVEVEVRENSYQGSTEYRLIFTVSCTFLYYYDLVTSLSPDILAAYKDARSGKFNKPLRIPVKAGQIIGRIGGRTLDFAVWDTTKPLSGFVVPEHYAGEAWKIYTADPLDYYTDDLKKFILSRYVRTAKPTSGKIDYDVDGRLVGNWFVEGSDGYTPKGSFSESYFTGHLSFAPDHFDPRYFVVSVGSLHSKGNDGATMQYMTRTNAPLPQNISVKTGLIKYDLVQWQYLKADGNSWDRNSLVKGGITAAPLPDMPAGCVLVKMLEPRRIKFEATMGKSCAALKAFTPAAKIYTR